MSIIEAVLLIDTITPKNTYFFIEIQIIKVINKILTFTIII